jgi:hypothetical protein
MDLADPVPLLGLIYELTGPQSQDPFVSNELRLAFRTVRHLARADEIGDAIVKADLDDLHRVLDHRPETWWDRFRADPGSIPE